MRKTLGIVAVALFVGAPVFAQAPFINYTLELGGNNHADIYEGQPAPALFTPGQTGDVADVATVTDATGLVTWAVRVSSGGTGTYGSDPVPVGGVANVVWDLKLEMRTGTNPDVWTPVGNGVGLAGNFGLGKSPAQGTGIPSVPGFLSTILDGVADGAAHAGQDPEPIEAAAFTWAFAIDGGGPAIISDALASGGPHMKRAQYPSTKGFPDGATEKPVRGVSTAGTGELLGMGAGYETYVGTEDGTATERGGVGLPADQQANGGCVVGDLPIAEGQLNLAGLAPGTYRLNLIPGRGNNVVLVPSQFFFPCSQGSGGGNFAQAATATGDTIQFVIPDNRPAIALAPSTPITVSANQGSAPANVVVNLTNNGVVGSTLNWTVSDDAAWLDVTPASGALAQGASAVPLTVSFAGAAALAAGTYNATITVADPAAANSPQTIAVTLTVNVVIPPALVSAKSYRTHTGVAAPLGIEFFSATMTECRKNIAPLSLGLKYNMAIGGTPSVTVNGVAAAAGMVGDTLTITSPAVVANSTCAVIVVNGVADAANPAAVAPAQTLKLKVRYADVTGDGRVNAGDTDVVRFASSPALVTEAKCHLDVDLSGRVNAGDTDEVRFKSSPSVTSCP